MQLINLLNTNLIEEIIVNYKKYMQHNCCINKELEKPFFKWTQGYAQEMYYGLILGERRDFDVLSIALCQKGEKRKVQK